MNIIWKKSDATVVVSFLTGEVEWIAQEAERLHQSGAVPPDWEAVAVDYPLPEDFGECSWTWDASRIELVVDLAAAKAAKLAAINAERDRREREGFPYLGKVLDSNPRSVQRITAAALAAQAALAAGQPFSLDWTCADNSTLTLDAAGMIGMPVALARHAAVLHDHARALKMTTEAAIDQVEMSAIDIQAGWPDWVL